MTVHRQFVRYAIVGLSSNAVLYLIYLVVTSFGIGHKTAMTLLYPVGILQTFLINRRWTFNHTGRVPVSFFRYVVSYVIGYLINLAALYVLVDAFGLPHQAVQGVLIFVVAGAIFMLQKFWVFSKEKRPAMAAKQHVS